MRPEPRAAIVGIGGTVLTADERSLFAERPPLGVIVFSRNIENKQQVIDLAASVRQAVPGCLIMVDQEGGRVARLRPPHWRTHPAAARLGQLFARDPAAGRRATFLTGALIGLDCAAVGIDVVCAPVLDLAVQGASSVVGDRAYDADPDVVTSLAAEMAGGLLAAGVQPVGKHVPGHGRAVVDSHLALPLLDDVAADDLVPFSRNAWLPWMMTAHILYRQVDPSRPATLSRAVLQEVVRGRIGFGNVLVSDDLSMRALSGDPGSLAAAALAAGCDVALHCSGVLAETRAVLEAAPAPDAPALGRLAAAAALAASRMQSLDEQAMAAERAGLLG